MHPTKDFQCPNWHSPPPQDDMQMFVHNRGLESAAKHLKGIRNIYVMSARNATFL